MSKSTQNFWFPFFLNDYCNATGDLTHLQHGSYLACMLAMYRSGKPIPKAGVYRAVSAITKAEQDSVDYILARFFKPREGDCWGHDRIEEEIRDTAARIAAKRKGGQSTSEAKVTAARENVKKATAARIERDFNQAELLAESPAPPPQHHTQHHTQQKTQQKTQPTHIQHNTTQHNTTQHNTTQHNTTQHNTTQHNTTQHNTTQH